MSDPSGITIEVIAPVIAIETGNGGALVAQALAVHVAADDIHPIAGVAGLDEALAAKAPLASPALTGTPSAPTAAPGTSTTQLATTAYAKGEAATAEAEAYAAAVATASADATSKASAAQAAAIAAAALDATSKASAAQAAAIAAAALDATSKASAAQAAAIAASQPSDAELTALAGLTTVADTLAYWTGSATAALTTLTGFGRSLIAAADAPAAKVLLSLGLLASTVSGQTATLTGGLTAARTYTLPDTTGTLALLGFAQSWAALQTFTAGLTVSTGTTAVQALTATSSVLGTDPGGSALLRVGGGVSCTTLTASGANHILGAYTGQTIVEVSGLSTANNSPIIDLYRSGASIGTIGVQGGYVRLGVNAVGNHTDATLAGLVLGVSDTIVQIAGTTPGTAPAGQVLIGGGAINMAGGITCTAVTASGSGVLGATALLASERLRVAGGTMGTPGATDVLMAAGAISCGAGIRCTQGVIVGTLGALNSLFVDIGGNLYAARIKVATDANVFIRPESDFGAFSGVAIDFRNDSETSNCSARFRASSYVFTSGGDVSVANTTASTNSTTGALTVAGGLGVAGRVSATEFASGTTKVLGAQGSAVADATDAATAITQLNALLARCRAHGLIA